MMTIKSFAIKNLCRVLLVAFFIVSSCVHRQSKQHKDSSLQTEPQSLSFNVDETLNNNSEVTTDGKSNDKLFLISWNIQDLGQSKNDREITFIVDVLRNFDVVLLQEVVAKDPAGAQKVAQIADELNRKGSKWDYRISNPTKSPSANMSERYAFLWKTSKVSIVGRAYLDDELSAMVVREPYIAEFKMSSNGNTFYAVNFHSRKYNDNPELEIVHFKHYKERLNTDKLIIAGDFNLNEKHQVWNPLHKQGFKSALLDKKTTLKRKCAKGNYLSHQIDNIYYSKKINFVSAKVVDYIKTCDNLLTARMISDHLPVFMEFSIEEY